MRGALDRARRVLAEPVDAASLAALRIAFGTVMLIATVRFAANGWIDELYVEPRFHFTYWGFGWVRPWHELGLPSWSLHAHFALLGVACALVALGLFYRVAIVLFVLLFGYVELLDVTYYLNHYYAITLVGLLLCAMPAHRAMSLDALLARRRGAPMPETVARVAPFALRLQLGIVYFFAGVAKVQGEWLLRAEPLRTWLLARSDVPLVGRLFAYDATAYAMSWAGCVFDLAIPFLLASRRTRAPAYLAVIAFHATTGWLFPIGMFPWVMIALTPIFFDPSWPRRLVRRLGAAPANEPSPDRRLAWPIALALGLHALIQIALPLRHHAYRGDVLWNEMGFRYAWHVMIAERDGWAEYRAIDRAGHVWHVDPGRTLTPFQARMMATQPDLILRFAHHVHDELAREGHDVAVHADVWVAWNGRTARRLVDPTVDLAREEDGLGDFDWVLEEDDPRSAR